MSLQARYTIRRKIADGGTAEIFLATQQGAHGFEKRVVLKRIFTAFYADPQFRNMLIDEAHIAMSLNHSNIVQVLDLGESEGQYFLALELVDGWTLDSVLRRVQALGAAIPPPIALYIAAEVCRALAYAHGKSGPDGKPLGIVHRDISPHNVLLSEQGEVKITDFGIAKSHNRREKSLGNLIKGKIAFMSPEQASGEPLDGRSDLFSLGTILYVMITRKYPFDAPTDYETLLLVKAGQYPPPEEVRPGLNPELYRVLKRAMKRNREERYQHAEEMLVDVEQVMRLAFRAVGQTELMRWLSDLAARDGVLPLTKQGEATSGAIPGTPHQSVVQSSPSGPLPGGRRPPPPIPASARSIRKAPEPTVVDRVAGPPDVEGGATVGAAPRENLKTGSTEDLTLEPLLEEQPARGPIRPRNLESDLTEVMAVAGPAAHETPKAPQGTPKAAPGTPKAAPETSKASGPSSPSSDPRGEASKAPSLKVPLFARPARLFVALAALVLVVGVLAFVQHSRRSAGTTTAEPVRPEAKRPTTAAATEPATAPASTRASSPPTSTPGAATALAGQGGAPAAISSSEGGAPAVVRAPEGGLGGASGNATNATNAPSRSAPTEPAGAPPAKTAETGEEDDAAPGQEAEGAENAGPSASPALVTIKTTPPGALVRQGKKTHGVTPVDIKLKKGRSYELVLTKDGYSPLTKKIRIGQSPTQRFNLALHKLPTTSPAGQTSPKKPDEQRKWWQVWR